MKYLFLLLLSLPMFVNAQDCGIVKSTDQFTRAPQVSTGFIPIGKNKITIDAAGKLIDIFIAINKAEGKCFDDASTAVILFDDGKTRLNFRNTGSMNCEGYFHFTFTNAATTPSALQRLATKKIGSIKLINGKIETVFTFSDDEKQLFSDKLTCLITEAKTLIQ